jgi:tetratricopeptide (TPR) repeat protein
VAGLTAIAPDDIIRRAERARRRSARIRNGVIATMLLLVAGGVFFGWRSYRAEQIAAEQQVQLNEIETLVAKYSAANPAQAGAPDGRASLKQAITAIANGSAADARYAKALELLKEGKPAEAEPLLKAVAEEKAARLKHDAKQAAVAFRNLGAIAGLADPRRAREHYARALEVDPDNVEALVWAANFEQRAVIWGHARDVLRATPPSRCPPCVGM